MILKIWSMMGFVADKKGNGWVHRSVICIIVSVLMLSEAAWAVDNAEATKQIDLRNKSYPELGWTTQGINLGYWHKRVGLRLANYYYGEDRNGMMLNLGYKLSDNERTQQSLNFMAGKYVGSDPGADYDYAYAGIAYGINFSIWRLRGLFFEIGLAKVLHDNLGNVSGDPVVPCGNIGYLYRFTP